MPVDLSNPALVPSNHIWALLGWFERIHKKKCIESIHWLKGANPTELLRDLEEMWGGSKYQATDEDVLYLSQGSRDMLEQCSEAYKSVKFATRCTVARRRQFLKDHKATITVVRDWVLLNATSERSNNKNPGKRDLMNFLTGKDCPPTNTKQSGGVPKAHPTLDKMVDVFEE